MKPRLFAKKNTNFKSLRTKLRDIIEKHEISEWSHFDKIDDNKLLESYKDERIVELERSFILMKIESFPK